jgi:pilus assembly protein TadC
MKPKLVAVGVGVATAVFFGGWTGPVAGVVTAAVLWRLLPRWLAAGVSREQRRAAADLSLSADLMAAALAAGAPPDRATQVVGDAMPGPLGERLVRVATALRLGERPDGAWLYLSDVPGGARLVRVAIRSADSGAALATALVRLAEDLRAARVAATESAARRAGVLLVLPLGLCFLPAFLLAGVVPVVIAVLDGVLE